MQDVIGLVAALVSDERAAGHVSWHRAKELFPLFEGKDK
jgi:hypothetical protein